MNIKTKQELKNILDNLGYKISESDSFNYFNSANKDKWNARSCYIVEKDSGLSFANIYARRDANFKALQEFRYNANIIIKNRVYEI